MQIETSDGVFLHVDPLAAEGERVGIAVLLHAMMVDRRSLDRPRGRGLATTLARRGLDVWNVDFRGHGRSGDLGPWSYDDLVYRDIPALVAAARDAGGPVWVVGQSLGGHTTLASIASGAASPDGLVMLSGNIWRPGLDPSIRRRIRRHGAMLAMRGVSEAAGRFPSRRLRAGPCDEALPYVRDLTRFWFTDRWADRDGREWTPLLAGVDVPVLSVIGRGDDLLAHHVGARTFVDPVPGHTFALVGRSDLGLQHDPDHMGLGADPRCEPVWNWVADWIRTRS